MARVPAEEEVQCCTCCCKSPQVSMWDSLISAKSDARLLDPMQKLRVMLEPIFEPILFRCKSDEDAGRTTMPCDDITASLMRPWRHHVSRARSPDPRRLCSHESRLAPRRLRL